jgi:hypothetical protein
MICRNCGTTIADKAIVCFRCGTPTDLPATPARAGRARPSGATRILQAVVFGIVLFLGIWLVPGIPTRLHSPDATAAGFAKLVGVCAGAVLISNLAARALRGRPPRRPV